ncbi:nucleotidyltransferase family protein [Loktanella sp. D2R18]|uniref:nucleotidyltransferase family protein n=1 Tax=Rhodobacterales TaxID=204455 RepID=UPI000DEA5E3F|nr:MULTISPECIES: nucleotidyltransferase family protein [Rhodobacterales]MDO6589465.1 nucleotidyltransferase family protein [Yoonia sp. 1_MG-2023]RBW44115.1 nucleotidyltransferase family protein [Loktanella sp. D2R18]
MHAPCPILILAAGKSTRMGGRDKLLEPVEGHALIRTQALRALATGQQVFVTLPAVNHPRAQVISDLNVHIVVVRNATEGLGASLRDGVAALPDEDAFMVVLADLVDIQAPDMDALLEARNAHPAALIWRGATQTGKPGHPIIFDGSLRPKFAQLTGDKGAAQIIAAHRDRVHLVAIGDQALLDLDTPADWASWRTSQ